MSKQDTIMRAVIHTRSAWHDHVRSIALAEGIPDSYRPVILFLHRHPGAGQRSIAEFAGITSSAVNQTVKSMLEDGFLYKEAAPSDKRSYRLYLTEEGKHAADRLRQKLEISDEAITAFIGADREAETVALLEQLSEFIRKELR